MKQTTILSTTFDCAGTPSTVSTTMQPGESVDEFFDRHEKELAQAKADCE